MAAPDELFVWEGDWGLPSVNSDCLVLLAYAQFSGAPLKVHKVCNPWRCPGGAIPALRTAHKEALWRPSDIIIHLRKQTPSQMHRYFSRQLEVINQHARNISRDVAGCDFVDHMHFEKYNADFDLSAKEAADSLAFIALIQQKLTPAVLYALWVEPKNYVEVTRRWYAEHMSFPLSLFLPGRMQRHQLDTLRLLRGDASLDASEELEKELYDDATDCMDLLAQRLGTQKFFFGDSPSSLDAFVFGWLAPILKCKLPSGKLQQHLKSLDNLHAFCTNILLIYFPSQDTPYLHNSAPRSGRSDECRDPEHVPNRRTKQFLSALAALGAMLSYALLTGMVSVQHGHKGAVEHSGHSHPQQDDDEDD